MLRTLRTHLGPCLLIALVGIGFFTELVLHPTQTLYSDQSDLLAMHVPMKRFLVRSFQETGEIPLWNPHTYAGMPFAHDVQVGAFYPLNAPLYFVDEEYIGAAMSWLVVLHVLIAGWCMYAYASSQGLGQLGALVAAFGYMFAGKWLLHLLAGGHYPMLGLAWMPLVLLFLERAIHRASLLDATWAGCAFALIILGSHPQVTFFGGLFVGLWTLGPALETAGWFRERRLAPLPRSLAGAVGLWLGLGLWTVFLAASLAAVQLLPNIELIPWASRAQGMESRESWQLAFWKLTQLVGPPPGDLAWENQGGFGVLWLAAALMALVIGPPRLRYPALVGLVVIAFGLGGAALVEGLPGFRYFRIPARMLWFAAIPVTLLAGHATQALFAKLTIDDRQLSRCRLILLSVAIAAVILMALNALMVKQLGQAIRPGAESYWKLAPVLLAGCFVLLLGVLGRYQGWSGPAWCILLVAELWAIARPALEVRPESEVYAPSACVTFLKEHGEGQPRVLDRDLPNHPANSPVGYVQPLLKGIEPVRGWSSLDIGHYQEFLWFIADVDGETRPHDIVDNFPIKNKTLLDLLAVQYVVQPCGKKFRVGDETPLAANEDWQPVARDERPTAYGVVLNKGVCQFPPYVVYENRHPLPRAWIVPDAQPLPERDAVLAALKRTDFRKTVLLEGAADCMVHSSDNTEETGEATILSHRPNEIAVHTRGMNSGYLVLSEVWFPGWTCVIDGTPTPIYRANYAFRAIELPAGEHEVVFRFDPMTFRWGRAVSLVALTCVLVLASAAFVARWQPSQKVMASAVSRRGSQSALIIPAHAASLHSGAHSEDGAPLPL